MPHALDRTNCRSPSHVGYAHLNLDLIYHKPHLSPLTLSGSSHSCAATQKCNIAHLFCQYQYLYTENISKCCHETDVVQRFYYVLSTCRFYSIALQFQQQTKSMQQSQYKGFLRIFTRKLLLAVNANSCLNNIIITHFSQNRKKNLLRF